MLKVCANVGFMFKEKGNLFDRITAAHESGFCCIENPDPYEVPLDKIIKTKHLVRHILINSPKGDSNEAGLAALPEKEEKFRDSLQDALRYATGLDCPIIHILAGIKAYSTSNSDEFKKMEKTYINNLKYASMILNNAGKIGVIEPISHYGIQNYFLDSYFQEINEENLKLLLDVYHLQRLHGNLSENLNSFLPHVGHIQISQVPGRNEPDTFERKYKIGKEQSNFHLPNFGGRKVRFLILLASIGITLILVVNRNKSNLLLNQILDNNLLQSNHFNSIKPDHWSEIQTFPVIPFPNVKVFCWILTRKQNLETRAIYIRKTWAKRCDKTVFFQSGSSNATFPVIGLKIRQRKESKNNNIVKAIRAWRYVYHNYGQDYDFFLKTDDDVYVILENLKLFLADKNPSHNEFYAQKTLLGTGEDPFDQAGSGLILTRQSLRKLNEEIILGKSKCLLEDRYGDAEDWKTSFCLSLVSKSKGIDTLDSLGRERILLFRAGDLMANKVPGWFKEEYSTEYNNMIQKGKKCCSFYPFAFHEIKGTYHLMLDYIFYNSRVSGDEYLIDHDLYDKIHKNGHEVSSSPNIKTSIGFEEQEKSNDDIKINNEIESTTITTKQLKKSSKYHPKKHKLASINSKMIDSSKKNGYKSLKSNNFQLITKSKTRKRLNEKLNID